ncbi:hypothetical protein ACQKLN_11040 [Paenibacillus glucanolyticus]|uniref:hypothetical protein n=1 Tax=Paenibacillus glucanolyticus TaxID=59843 RepID=UPI0034D012AE
MYETEIHALSALEPAASLIAQITEWRRPGEYRFKADFPAEYKQWVRTANTLRKSKDRDFRDYGQYMRRFSDVITELDELPKDSRKFRRKMAEFGRIVDQGLKVHAKLNERVEVENGI